MEGITERTPSHPAQPTLTLNIGLFGRHLPHPPNTPRRPTSQRTKPLLIALTIFVEGDGDLGVPCCWRTAEAR